MGKHNMLLDPETSNLMCPDGNINCQAAYNNLSLPMEITNIYTPWEGNGNPLQCSCLENPRDGGAWWAAVHGVAQSQTWLKWLSSSSNFNKYSNRPIIFPNLWNSLILARLTLGWTFLLFSYTYVFSSNAQIQLQTLSPFSKYMGPSGRSHSPQTRGLTACGYQGEGWLMWS